MEIRPMQWGDIDNGLLKVLSNLSKVVKIPLAHRQKIWSALASREDSILVAEEEGKIIGTATLIITWKYLRGGVKSGRISDVATHPKHEGKGIGSKLVQALIEVARCKGCYKITLSCSEENRPWYERFGFRQHEVAMRLDL